MSILNYLYQNTESLFWGESDFSNLVNCEMKKMRYSQKSVSVSCHNFCKNLKTYLKYKAKNEHLNITCNGNYIQMYVFFFP